MSLKRFQHALGGAGVVAGAALAVVVLSSGATRSSGATVSPVSVSQIKSIALDIAKANGDAQPSSIEMSAQTTREQANWVSSRDDIPAKSGGTDISYLVVEHGHFAVANSEGLPGSPTPTGTVLTLVINARTGHVTDFGVQNTTPHLASLGAIRSVASPDQGG
jgi:hypothetical protein